MPTLVLSGPTFIPLGGSGTFCVVFTGSDGANSLFPPNTPGWPDPIGITHDGTYCFTFTPDPTITTYDVVFYDSQTNTYSNHLLVQVGIPAPDWHLFPIQPSTGTKATGKGNMTLVQHWKQPATLTCSFLDPQGLLAPSNKISPYNIDPEENYDPLLDVARKILLRVGTPCYPNLAAGIVPTCSLAITNAAYLTDNAFGTISDSTANYAQISPGSSSPFTLTIDLGAQYFLRHCVIRFASKVGTCTLPASVQVRVSQDNVSYTAFKSSRPAGGTGGDCDDDYGGINYEMIFADLDDVMARMPGNQARYVQFVIIPTGAQTLLLDELAVYGATSIGGASQGRTILGHNVFVGYLGNQLDWDNAGNVSFTATDVLKRLQDNNSVDITAEFTNSDVGDILYSLLTGGAYWAGRLNDYDAPFLPPFIGWQPKSQTGVGLTGMVYPIWQSQSQSMLGYCYELADAIGWYFYTDGNGALQMVEPSYTQETADRILIADMDGNGDVFNCQRHGTDAEIRNVWQVSSGKQQQPGSVTTLEEPNSIARFGRRVTKITDPVATTSDIQAKVCAYGIREYAWRRWRMLATILPFFEDRPKKLHGLRASLRPYLHSKSNGSSWDRELWSVEGLTHRIGFGTWEADVEYAPYFPQGPQPPTLLNGSQGMSETASAGVSVTLTWEAISDPSVQYVNIYRSTSANGTTGLPEVQPSTFTKIAQVAVGTTTYTDGSLIAGQDYWYYLTTVDSFGTESVGSAVLWARPGTGAGTTNDWAITDLAISQDPTQAPRNGVNYYVYEIYLTFTAPPIPAPVPDNGQGGLKGFEMMFALGSVCPSTADLSQWTYTDEWHGERVKPGYQPIGMDAADQTAGQCQWYMRFRSLVNLHGDTIWVLLVTSDMTTKMHGEYRSNVCSLVLS